MLKPKIWENQKETSSSPPPKWQPNENFASGTSVNREFFSNFTELLFFSQNVKNAEENNLRFPPQKRRSLKKIFSSLTWLFDKNTGHRVTKFYPVSHVSITYKSYLMTFSLTQKIFWGFFFIPSILSSSTSEGRDRVVGRAVDSKSEISGSNPIHC